MYFNFLTGLLFLLGAVSIVQPRYPPNAIAGGTVVAVVTNAGATVQNVDILSSDPPFADPVESALARSRFGTEGIQKTLVVVHFRYPQIYLLGPAKQEIPLHEHPTSLPYPKYIVQPAFPINAIGEVCVVFYVDITEKGTVSDARIVQSSGNLKVGLDTVKKWEFLPAHGESGTVTPSHAYIVLVFRPPVTSTRPEPNSG